MQKLTNLPKIAAKKSSIKSVPQSAGVYIFFSSENNLKKRKPIYIGKAINLRSRLNSYYFSKLLGKTANMVAEAKEISFILVNSELEALLLEAQLIRSYWPKYNVVLKDDKRPLYIRITNENFPRVLVGRTRDLKKNDRSVFGPFASSANVVHVLKWIRRIFPYADHGVKKTKCFYSHIGLCNPCPTVESTSEEKRLYRRNINYINGVLSGRFSFIRKKLVRQMAALSDELNYESALEIRRKIERLDYITQEINPVSNYLQNPNFLEDIRLQEVNSLKLILESISSGLGKKINDLRRIECYDVAHLAGTYPAASMVTFIDGEPNKSLYRHFGIRASRQKKRGEGSDDYFSLRQVAKRRAGHLDSWGRPDLIIVDGGKGQVGVFNEVFDKHKIAVIGIAKRVETLVLPGDGGYSEQRVPPGPARNLVQRLRNEAHRFARVYHHRLVSRTLFSTKRLS